MSSLRLPSLHALTLLRGRPAPGRVSLPDVCCDVIWTGEALFLNGPMTQSRPLDSGGEIDILRIEPNVARAWLGAPLLHFTNQLIPLADFNKSRAEEILRLCEAGRLALLATPPEATRLEGRDLRLAAAAQALREGSTVRAAAVAAAWSERQLERQFIEAFGVSPKVFARITRFRCAIFAAKRGAPLADAAALAGYIDQAHFSRDVRAFTGQSPRAILPNVGNVQDVVAGDL